MKTSRKIFSLILVFVLVVGTLTVGVMLIPLKAKATNDSISETTLQSSSLTNNDSNRVLLSIPAILHVNNQTVEANGQDAYIPAFDAFIVAKPYTSGNYFPYDNSYMTSGYPGSTSWIYGRFAVSASSSVTFGDDYNQAITSTNFGFNTSWFSSTSDGIYRYQIFFYDDSDNSFGDMFTLPDMTSETNMLFLDFYISSGSVSAVVLVDANNNKLVGDNLVGSSTYLPSGDYSWINSATTISSGRSIDYNVVDVTVSNKVINSSRKSHFYYTAAVGSTETGGPIEYTIDSADLPANNGTTTGTMEYTYDSSSSTVINQFDIDEKYGDFTCTIRNYPDGQSLTVTQTKPQHTTDKLLVYTAEATQYSGDIATADDWLASVPTGYSTATSSPVSKDITVTVSSSNNAVSFVNVAVIELPPTGIRTTVIPFIVLIVLAGGLLAFFIKRKDREL